MPSKPTTFALRLEKLGYELERGKHGQPEVKGYTKEYLEASSPRREQIKDHLREQGIDGAAAAQIAAHHTRDRKELLSPGEVLQRHRELAAQYGHQADRVVAQARQHSQHQMPEPEVQAKQAVTWARDHVFERSAVQDRRAILETALVRGMGETTYARIRQEFERRIKAGEFREVSHVGPGRQYTTAVMVRMESEIVGRMQEGNRRDYGDPMLVSPQVRIATEDRHPELNASQRQAVDEIFLSREKAGYISADCFHHFRIPACSPAADHTYPGDVRFLVLLHASVDLGPETVGLSACRIKVKASSGIGFRLSLQPNGFELCLRLHWLTKWARPAGAR